MSRIRGLAGRATGDFQALVSHNVHVCVDTGRGQFVILRANETRERTPLTMPTRPAGFCEM